MLEEAIRKIEAQQGKQFSTVWAVGEQLNDILRHEPALAEIVSMDLDNRDMSLSACEQKIKARADELHKTAGGSGVCVTPPEAEKIIRRFYGLPEKSEAQAPSRESNEASSSRGEVVNLADFF